MRSPFFAVLTGLLLSGTTCIGTGGCSTDSVRHAFGYTEPALQVSAHKGLLGGGVSFKASSQFGGTVDATRDPDSGQITGFKATVNSSVTDVYDAQGRRITDNFLAARDMEYQFKIRQHELVNDFGLAVVAAIEKLGPDIVKAVVTSGASAGLDPAIIAGFLNSMIASQQPAIIPKETKVGQ